MAMTVLKLPSRLSCYPWLSMGAVGIVYKINDRIAIKYSVKRQCESFARENDMFDLFETRPPCQYIIQSFLRLPDANFLQFMSGGTLHDRLGARKVCDANGKVLQATYTEPDDVVGGWLLALCSAVVWLESLGYVHGDLRPNNMLLDEHDQLRLADFDCAERIGRPCDGGCAPWARLLGDGETIHGEWGSFGLNGTRTESFAIGSNLYCMVYGFEPYEDRDDRGPIVLQLCQEKEFPPLHSGMFTRIIDKCWHGTYDRLQDLLTEVHDLVGHVLPDAEVCGVSVQDCRQECQQMVEDGLLDLDRAKE